MKPGELSAHLYLLNFTLLATHEIDSAYWQEWVLFGIPGGIQVFLVLNFLLLLLGLWGYRQLLLGRHSGLVFSLVVAAAGVFAFGIHSYFLLNGHPEFRLPVSLLLIGLILMVSLAQGWFTIWALRSRKGSAPSLALLALLLAGGLLAQPQMAAEAEFDIPSDSPAGSLAPAGYQATEVQLVSERVILELKINRDGVGENAEAWAGEARILVNAHFSLFNTGTASEKMQVIFPLDHLQKSCFRDSGLSFHEGEPMTVTVGSQPARVKIITGPVPGQNPEPEFDCPEPRWASFPVTFPPQEAVEVTLSYALAGEAGGSQLFYILETGNPWKGAVGEVAVTFRMPFEITEEILERAAAGYQTEGNEIRWEWKELEPAEKDNLHVQVVEPRLWMQVLEKRAALNGDESNPDAWVELGQSLFNAGTLHAIFGQDSSMLEKAIEAYNQALLLQPDHQNALGGRLSTRWAICMTSNFEEITTPKPDRACLPQLMSDLQKLESLYPADPTVAVLKHLLPPEAFLITPAPEALATLTPAPTLDPATQAAQANLQQAARAAQTLTAAAPAIPPEGSPAARNPSSKPATHPIFWLSLASVGSLAILGGFIFTWKRSQP